MIEVYLWQTNRILYNWYAYVLIDSPLWGIPVISPVFIY